MTKWTREETIIAFNVYCKIPFKCSRKTHPLIIEYANIIKRTPSALNMKIGNIGRLDPDLKVQGITGLTHGAILEEEVWQEFYSNPEKLAYESEILISEFSKQSLVKTSNISLDDLPSGIEREVVIKQRVNQSFFRTTVMSSYNYKCCVSGISTPLLLEACHITDWAEDTQNRTNPKNGLCMNPFFHKAYDKYLWGITPDMSIIVSEELFQAAKDDLFLTYLKKINGRKILLPDRFLPQKDFLELKYNKFLNR